MPFSGPGDSTLPANVKKRSLTDRKRWVARFNSRFASCTKKGGSTKSCESKAFRLANGLLGESVIMNFREGLDDLKVAFSALRDAQKEYDEEPADFERDNLLGWIISDLRRLIGNELFKVEMNESAQITLDSINSSLEEIGAKLSKSSREAIEQALASLTALLSDEEVEEDVSDDITSLLSVLEEIEHAVKGRKSKMKKKVKETKTISPVAEAFNVTKDLLWEHAIPLKEIDGSSGLVFRSLVIEAGMSKNRVIYSPKILEASIGLLEGRGIYVDHPDPTQGLSRSLFTKAGWWDTVTYETNVTLASGKVTEGIVAHMNLLENSPVPWLAPMVQEVLERGHPEQVGISILGAGKSEMVKADDGGVAKRVLKIEQYASADAVAEPGAEGQPLGLVAAEGMDPDVKKLSEYTKEDLKEMTLEEIDKLRPLRPDLFEDEKVEPTGGDPSTSSAETKPVTTGAGATTGAPAATATVPVAETVPTGNAPSSDSVLAEQMTEMKGWRDDAMRANTQTMLQAQLAKAQLPAKAQQMIVDEVGDQILTEEQVTVTVERWTGFASTLIQENDSILRPRLSGMIVPYGQISSGDTPLDQVMLSLDHFFGAPIDEDKQSSFPKIRSIREFYISVTGDENIDGFYNPNMSVLRDYLFEALPTAAAMVGGATVTMTNLLGTSMNKALVNFYKTQPKWWEPVVTKRDLQNLKQQDRIRLHAFGSLTERTVRGSEYTELTWNETQETYTPQVFGNVIYAAREAIIDDDLSGIQSLPKLLAQAAAVTLNEQISALFTVNSGSGATLADGFNVLNAAEHQGNRVTTPLDRTSLLDLRKVVMKMNNDANKRIGLIPRHLLVPVDLEPDGFELFTSAQVPDSANNARNILADASAGLRSVISVPNWTDVSNWYLMVDPAESQTTTIEVGFLFGREEPDLVVQDQPGVGAVFTHDAMGWKVRFEVGQDFIDYRGIAGAVVT